MVNGTVKDGVRKLMTEKPYSADTDATLPTRGASLDTPQAATRQLSSTQHTLSFDGRTITLLGTAHVSEASVKEASHLIAFIKPDVVAVELDEGRRKSITDKDAWKKLDVISVLRRGDGFLLLANLALSSFQSSLGSSAGVKPGDEMVCAMKASSECGAKSVMVDRPIAVTLRRAWALSSFWGKCRLLAELFAMSFGGNEDVSTEDIEALKTSSEMDSLLNELSSTLPAVKTALIDERDRYLAAKIWQAGDACEAAPPLQEDANPSSSKGEGSCNIVAVLGAGHINGVMEHLKLIACGTESTDTSDIESVPKGIASRVLAISIPLIIVALIALGFIFGGRNAGGKMAAGWVVWNGALAAIGAAAALAHPLSILTSFIAAPLTSLCPLVGVGMASGIVQALAAKPTVSDMESLTSDAAKVKGWYCNKLLKVLLVFALSSVGSSIGTFIAGAGLIKGLRDVLNI